MKVLFVHPSCRFAIWDVARGYRAALGRLLGEESIRDYYLDKHMAYHERALPEHVRQDKAVVSRFGTENVLNEAVYFQADLVLIVSGLLFHPIALVALERVGIPVATILTENPYDDEPQREWAANYPAMAIFTHERYSAERWGWTYLPHAYDPAVHRPVEPDPVQSCDVLLVGTGWRERQAFLEQVDWAGINLRIVGPKPAWPALAERSPIWPYFHDESVDNETIAPRYAAAKICLNFHRRHPLAWSLNPRAYEIAACGAFQLSDPRPEVTSKFGGNVPVFQSPEELGQLVRRYLVDRDGRRLLAEESRRLIKDDTFDRRAQGLVEALVERFRLPWLQETVK